MPDMMADGQTWLAGQLNANVSRTVTCSRGGVQVTCQATVGTSVLHVDDGRGQVRIERPDRDYLIRAADLGPLNPPLRGDEIDDSKDGLRYEVLSPAGEPVYRMSDPFGVMLRIHTKQVA